MMDRRQFLKNTCFACLAIGAGVSLPACKPMQVIKASNNKGVFEIDEKELLPGNDVFLVRASPLEYDILLVRKNDTYTALYLQCTHNQNAVMATKTNIICNSHGAEFGFDGKVKKGPATEPLRKFPVSSANGKIAIRIS
ncbi:MAG: Rieske (2Fe-2S) iron-sulfur domain-containing protein [Bacteroidetes bacterium]|nr:MAG: Rieske (2Fe-2S) iron-sulfur domain-containing protein [Bacteroidota bacterium]